MFRFFLYCFIVSSSFPAVLRAGAEAAAVPVIGVSCFPLDDWCREIAPIGTKVVCLTDRPENPFFFTLGLDRVKRLSQAHVFVRFGYGLDDWVERTLPHSTFDRGRLLILEESQAELIQSFTDSSQSIESEALSPYYWLDPIWAQDSVRAIADRLKECFPGRDEEIEDRTQRYLGQLNRLHFRITEAISKFESRTYIGYTDSFERFAHCYGFQSTGIVCETEKPSPTLKQWKYLYQALRNAPSSVMVVESRDRRKAAASIERTGCRLVEFNPFGDPKQTAFHSYLEMMNANLQSLVEGFTSLVERESR